MNNVAGGVGGGIYAKGLVDISDNSIMHNSALDYPALYVTESSGNISRNTLIGNCKLPSNPASSSTVYIDGDPNFNYNNVHPDNATYKLCNGNPQGPPDLNATDNWWGTTEEAEIQAMIYDWFDDSSLGIVDYAPYSGSIRTDAPISPPTGLTVSSEVLNITLSWNPNPEPDFAGYKIYYDTDSGYPYRYFIDVGNVTTYIMTGLPSAIRFFTVTAYDAEADGNNDLFEGHESWYACEVIIEPDFSITADPDSLTFTKPFAARIETSTITISSIQGFNSSVTLSTSWIGEQPKGIISILRPTTLTPPSQGSATSKLILMAFFFSRPGTYTIRITGTSGSIVHTVDIAVTVS